MSADKAIQEAIDIIGLKKLARSLGITHQSIRGWQSRNRMPDSEYSGRTDYAVQIEKLTDGKVSIAKILGYIPVCAQK